LMRDGNDLVATVPISFTQASLGAMIEVPTLDGTRQLKVPAGTQHGSLFRIKGQGLPNLRTGRRGDELIRVAVEIPRNLTTAQQNLLRAFAETEDKNVMPESQGFFEKLKNHFGNDEIN
jgi:molecular chaperone DnaJ